MNLRRRGMSGAYYPNGQGLLPSAAAAAAADAAPTMTPVKLPAGSMLPNGIPSCNGTGRRMTWEEACAQQVLEMNQTIAGTNHLCECEPPPPGSPPAPGAARESRLPFNFMGIQGQTPAQIVLPPFPSTTVVVQFRCPSRQAGEIEFIANQYAGGGWVDGSGSLIWQVLIDGIPVQGYDSILASLGTTAAPGWLGKGDIQFAEGQLVQLVVKNVSVIANNQPLIGMLRGNFWPIEQQQGRGVWG